MLLLLHHFSQAHRARARIAFVGAHSDILLGEARRKLLWRLLRLAPLVGAPQLVKVGRTGTRDDNGATRSRSAVKRNTATVIALGVT